MFILNKLFNLLELIIFLKNVNTRNSGLVCIKIDGLRYKIFLYYH